MVIILVDVECLLHLSIKSAFYAYHAYINKEGVDALAQELLGRPYRRITHRLKIIVIYIPLKSDYMPYLRDIVRLVDLIM